MENKIIKAGTKIVIGMYAGQTGTYSMEAYILVSDWTESDLSDFAWYRGKSHAEMYGIYPLSEYQDCEDISEEELDSDEYSDDIEGWWELYDSDKHNGHLIFGCNNDFKFNEL